MGISLTGRFFDLLRSALTHESKRRRAMDIRDKALQVILKAKNPLISSVGEDGYPYTKAMLPPREHDGLSVFYFTTNTSSLRVSQYRKNPKASVYFFDAGSFTGVLLLGEMEVFTDQISRERIWRAGDTLYYPQGVTDADYAVLCFTARSGRLYEKFGTKDFGVP